MTKVISFVIRKGGSAKTTSTVNLAAGLAKIGKKTLLIDLEPQACATESCGLEPLDLPFTLLDWVKDTSKNIEECLYETVLGFDILASHYDMEDFENAISNHPFLIKSATEKLIKDYDYVVIDTGPAINGLTTNALFMSSHCVIPMQTHYRAYRRVEQTIQRINEVQKNGNPDLKFLGILPTMYQKHVSMSKRILKDAQETYNGTLMPLVINYRVAVQEGDYTASPVVLRDDSSSIETNYREFVDLIVKQTEGDS